MDYKDLLPVILSSSVISTFVTTLLTPILESVKSKQEQNRINSERKYNKEKEEREQLKEIYTNAIRIILLIKNGFFDDTLHQISNIPLGSPRIKEEYEKLNKKVEKINNLIDATAPLMRLYATDEIFELFSRLIEYGKFSYSDNIITQFLLYSFDRDFTYMCQAMQKNLEIRVDNPKLPELHICPYCGKPHNSEENCPFCNIPWIDAIEMEDKFNEECKHDKSLQQLLNCCRNKQQDPFLLLSYPLNKDKWIEKIKEFLDMSNQKGT